MSDFLGMLLDLLKNAAFTTVVVACLAFVARSFIKIWLENNIGERTKRRLSELEAIQAKEQAEISSLRQFLISGRLARNEALLKKQLDASEILWSALISNKRHSSVVQILQSLNIEEVNKSLGSGKMDEFVKVSTGVSGFDSFLEEAKKISPEDKNAINRSASLQRPFISPLAWALYQAHNAITMHAVATLIAWKSGMDTKLLKNKEVVETAITALPHQKPYIDKYGIAGIYFLLEELEKNLLTELRRFIKDGETSQDLEEQAAALLTASNKIRP